MGNVDVDETGLADFLTGWRGINISEQVTVAYAVIGLTNFGETPAPSTRLAEILGRPVSEAEELAPRWGWPGTRVDDGLISVDPERAKAATRRHVRIGDRRLGVTGCGPDVFMYAPLVRPSLQLEETCPATGTPIRILFTPQRVERVDPSGAVVAMNPLEVGTEVDALGGVEDVDATVCAQMPVFSSVEAAQGWLADHPGGRVFPIEQAWDLSPFRGVAGPSVEPPEPRQAPGGRVTAKVTRGSVEVEGAELYFERRGSGPALQLITGGGGSADFDTAVADILADRYTVLTYDRRGISRSRLTGPPTEMDMSQQADDAATVLKAADAGLVFGNSGGATIALHLATRHPG